MTAKYIRSVGRGDELEDAHLFPYDGLCSLVAEDHFVGVLVDDATRLREHHVHVAAGAHAERLEVVVTHRQPQLLVTVGGRRAHVELVSYGRERESA